MSRPMYQSFTENQLSRFKPQIPIFNTDISVPCWGSTKDSRDIQAVYRSKLSTEWSPIERTKTPIPRIIQTPIIYYSHIGLLPNYRGHAPGDRFRYGKTFGSSTINSKACLSKTYSD